MTLRRFLFPLIFLLLALSVQASDLVMERGWVEDPSGNMTLQEVTKATETPFAQKLFLQGYSKSAFWIRLRIDPEALEDKSAQSLIVRMRPPYQDQIWIFDPLVSQDKVRVTGDYFDWADDEYRSLNLNFIIPVGTKPRDIWLKLKTNTSLLLFVEVLTEGQVREADRRQEIAAMIYLSVLFVCFGWAVLMRINNKDKLLTYYLVREFVVITYALAVLGYLRFFTSSFLPMGWLDTITTLILLFFASIVIWFDWRLIDEFKPNRWLARLHGSLFLFFPLLAILVFIGKTNEAARISSVVIIAAVFLALFSAISTKAWAEARHAPEENQPPCSKWFLIFLYTLVAVIGFLHRLPIMGIFSGSEFFVYFNLVYPLVTSISLMSLVQIRLNRLSNYQQKKQRRLEVAEIEIRTERAQRIEQANFLKMLAHEMKTPLSVVRLALGGVPLPSRKFNLVDRAITDMDRIIERLLQVERLEDNNLEMIYENFDLHHELKRLCLSIAGGDRIHIDGHGQLTIYSDQKIVYIIFSNLLENALKYSPEGTPVNISINGKQDSLLITVENEPGNAGFPSQNQVFEKYYRAALARERTGSGLGLYLVKSLLTLLGGHISYLPDPKVVRFEVTIPRQYMKV